MKEYFRVNDLLADVEAFINEHRLDLYPVRTAVLLALNTLCADENTIHVGTADNKAFDKKDTAISQKHSKHIHGIILPPMPFPLVSAMPIAYTFQLNFSYLTLPILSICVSLKNSDIIAEWGSASIIDIRSQLKK